MSIAFSETIYVYVMFGLLLHKKLEQITGFCFQNLSNLSCNNQLLNTHEYTLKFQSVITCLLMLFLSRSKENIFSMKLNFSKYLCHLILAFINVCWGILLREAGENYVKNEKSCIDVAIRERPYTCVYRNIKHLSSSMASSKQTKEGEVGL